jgi:hypothetical protein
MLGGLIGLTILAVAPDLADPGARQGAHAVRVALALLVGVCRELGCPCVTTHTVLGEVNQPSAQAGIAGLIRAGRVPRAPQTEERAGPLTPPSLDRDS